MCFAFPNYILNDEGIEEKDAWLDLKKYLKDFSNIKEKKTEMVAIWNYYLTYSMVLGLPSIAKKQITSFFGSFWYNSKKNKTKVIQNFCELHIIRKLAINGFPQNIQEEIHREIDKY